MACYNLHWLINAVSANSLTNTVALLPQERPLMSPLGFWLQRLSRTKPILSDAVITFQHPSRILLE